MTSTTQPKYLLAIDPGLATGVAILDITDLEDVKVLNSWEMDIDEFSDFIEDAINTDGVEIVCERFIITVQTAKLSQAPWSMELIGTIRFLTRKYGKRLTLQKPDQKTFAPNEKLKLVGFWHKGGGGHANDAFRHAMVYMVNRHPQWAKRLIV